MKAKKHVVGLLLLVAVMFAGNVEAGDKSHCPNDSGIWFSPTAPDWVCNAASGPTNQIPEPGSAALVAIALVALRIVRRKRAP